MKCKLQIYCRSYVFISMLLLPEGQADEPYEPFSALLFPPKIKVICHAIPYYISL